jgi:hypothetical protein
MNRPPSFGAATDRRGDSAARDVGRREALRAAGLIARTGARGRWLCRAGKRRREAARSSRGARARPSRLLRGNERRGGARASFPADNPGRPRGGRRLDRDGRPFHDALVHPADPADVAEWLETTPAPESHSLDRRAPAGARRAGHARCRRIRPTYVFVWPVRLRQDLFAGTRPGTAPRRDGPPSRHPRPELRLRPARRAADRCRRAAGRRLRRGCDRGRRPKRRDGAPTRSRGARSERACGRTGARPGRRPRGVRARRRDARRARGVRRTGENQTSRTRGRFASEPRTSAFRAGSCGPAAGLGRSSTMSSVAMPAVSSSISALWRHARSKPSPRRPCSQRSGGGGPIASPSSS